MVEAYIGGDLTDAEKERLAAMQRRRELVRAYNNTHRLVTRSLISLIFIELITIAQYVVVATFFGTSLLHLVLSILVLVACVGAAVILLFKS